MRLNAYLDHAVAFALAHPLGAVAAAFAAGMLSWFLTRPRDVT